MTLDQTSTFSFSERLTNGEDPANLLPRFNGAETLISGNDTQAQRETLRALNAVLTHLKDKNQRISRFFPLKVGLKTYNQAQDLAQDIQRLKRQIEPATTAEGPKPIGEAVGSVVSSVVAAMKTRGTWNDSKQRILDQYLANRDTPNPPLH